MKFNNGTLSFRNGYHCPSAYNPADFLIGVLANTDTERGTQNAADKLCDAFIAVNQNRNQMVYISTNSDWIEDRKYEIQKPLWIITIYWLIYRNLLIVVRDPSIQKLRIVQKIVYIDFHS